MHTKLLSVALAATILSGCGTVTSKEEVKSTQSYVGTAAGNVLGSGGGHCLNTGIHGEDLVGACEGEEKVAEKVAEAVPVAAPAPPPPAPPPPPPPPPPPEAPASVEKVVLSGRALFPYDSAQLTGQGNSEMNTLIDKLKTYSDIELVDVVGHADSRGTLEYNQGLSERRAETVKAKLEGSFPQVPITASGLGETAPIASNDTEDGRRLNRRVEIRVEAIN